jgi:hypothetical protein
MSNLPRISFGIITLNAQPFLEYNLRALYPFAYQLLVVEGATEAAKSLAAEDGHSLDGTLEMLKRFQETQDPEHKLQIIRAKQEGYVRGFWPEKDHMSQAYARRAKGDWLWQVDGDEFYKQDDMRAIVSMLERDSNITAVSFPYIEFFGGFDYVITGKWHLYEHPSFHRLFKWKSGYSYVSHRPPTVLNEKKEDLRTIKWVDHPQNGKSSVFLFHYSYVFPKQAQQKVGYYSHVSWTEAFRGNQRWLDESFLGLEDPFFLGEKGKPILQWLERYRETHPEAIQELRANIDSGIVQEKLRPTTDIEKLLNSPAYWLATSLLHMIMPSFWKIRTWLRSIFMNVEEKRT